MSKTNKATVTFVLPGDNRSGGVRVTTIMGNLLLSRGWNVRIAFRDHERGLRAWCRAAITRKHPSTTGSTGWLHEFKGVVSKYRQINQLYFGQGEIVIAVGSMTARDVRAIRAPVIKVRYNHGFPAKPTREQRCAWKGDMPTITVSQTLVRRLEQEGGPVLGVVPNGIDCESYYIDSSTRRDGLGAVYYPHPNKAPGDLIAVMQEAHCRWPQLPQYMFGLEDPPIQMAHAHFELAPSVDRARALYNRARIWLLTSYTEGLPGVVLEAMACGCVVISSDNDGSLEIIRHEENGLIVRRGDVNGFIEQIARVLADPSLADKIVSEGQKTVRRFSWDRAADKMEAFLHSFFANFSDCRLS